MRILVISNYYPPYHGGGYGLHCQWYSEALADRGHDVRILTSRPEFGWDQKRMVGSLRVERELKVIPHASSPLSVLLRTRANARAVTRAIRQFRPDVIYHHGNDGVGFQVYHTATESGIPTLTTVGDTWLSAAWENLSRYDPWIAVATAKSATGCKRAIKLGIGMIGKAIGLYVSDRPRRFHSAAVISSFLADELNRVVVPNEADIRVNPPMLPRGYFTLKGHPIGPNRSRVNTLRALFVGRIELLKGLDTAIDALAYTSAREGDITLTVAGIDGGALGMMKEHARRQSVASRITWLGTVSDNELLTLYRSHDVFLFPSRVVEGFGMVNAEAMACGLPVLGTVFSGARDIIRDGENGFGISPTDSTDLGERLLQLKADRQLLARLSLGAMRTAEQYHPDRVVDVIESLLAEAVRRVDRKTQLCYS